MCNGTWVCFACRYATRRPTWRQVTYVRPWLIGGTGNDYIRCPSCRQSCHFLGPTIELPPKRDVRGWKRLHARIDAVHTLAVDGRMAELSKYRRELEARIAVLERRPESRGRSALIARMRDELAQVGRDIGIGDLHRLQVRRFV